MPITSDSQFLAAVLPRGGRKAVPPTRTRPKRPSRRTAYRPAKPKRSRRQYRKRKTRTTDDQFASIALPKPRRRTRKPKPPRPSRRAPKKPARRPAKRLTPLDKQFKSDVITGVNPAILPPSKRGEPPKRTPRNIRKAQRARQRMLRKGTIRIANPRITLTPPPPTPKPKPLVFIPGSVDTDGDGDIDILVDKSVKKGDVIDIGGGLTVGVDRNAVFRPPKKKPVKDPIFRAPPPRVPPSVGKTPEEPIRIPPPPRTPEPDEEDDDENTRDNGTLIIFGVAAVVAKILFF